MVVVVVVVVVVVLGNEACLGVVVWCCILYVMHGCMNDVVYVPACLVSVFLHAHVMYVCMYVVCFRSWCGGRSL